MKKLLLVNPNTSSATTSGMLKVAMEEAAGRIEIDAATVERGPAKVVDIAGLETAADAVSELLGSMALSSYAGIIIGGFGDPGLEQVRGRTRIPVTGIAEAAAAEAAASGRRFSVIMTTPGLVPAIETRFAAYGCRALLASIRVLHRDAAGVAQEPAAIEAAVHAECEAAIREDRVQAVLIGGGPLAPVARALRSRLAVPIVEPIPAAVRLALARAQHVGVAAVRYPI
jgi:allantoin racemase